MSIVCESFGCTPDEAEKQNWQKVKSIMEYRALSAAKEQHNKDVTQLTEGQVALWKEMLDATDS